MSQGVLPLCLGYLIISLSGLAVNCMRIAAAAAAAAAPASVVELRKQSNL